MCSDPTTRSGVTHFIVASDGASGYIAADQTFDSLSTVIKHYGSHKLGKCTLGNYVSLQQQVR